MSKIRVYDLSKQLGLSNQAVITLLQTEFGVEVKSHSSTVENDVAGKLVAKHQGSSAPAVAPSPVDAAKTAQKTNQKNDTVAPKPAASSVVKPAVTPSQSPPPVSGGTTPTSSADGVTPPVQRPANKPASHQGQQKRVVQPQPPIILLPARQNPQQRPGQPGQTGMGGRHGQNTGYQGQQRPGQAGQPGMGGRPGQNTGYQGQQRPGQAGQTGMCGRPGQNTGYQGQQRPGQAGQPGMGGQQDQPPRAGQPGSLPQRPGAQAPSSNATKEPVAVLDKQPVKKSSPDSRKSQTGRQENKQDSRNQQQPRRNEPRQPAEPETPLIVDLDQDLTVAELSQKLQLRETEIIKHLFMKGMMVTVNQNVEVGFARSIATELGIELTELKQKIDPRLEQLADVLDKKPKLDAAKYKHLMERAPVVSIMGHVDHGKTSLLDAIRSAKRNIVDTEAGGITQRIGAYAVEKDGKRIVFLDTPGHEAFTTMRMRGAKSTDIAILVVAADDGVMPQTIEAISHAKAAEIPIIVAINKVDKEGADPDRVLSGLSDHGLVAEKWGGETITVEVSALQQLGIDDLLEMILLVTELLDLKADSTVPATGVIIEAKLDKRKGPVATALVQNGMLKIGDNVLIGTVGGRVRALLDDRSERVNQAGPSTPVEILGLSEVPSAGDVFEVFTDDKRFKQELNARKLADKEARQSVNQPRTVGLVARGEDEEGPKFIHLIIKADTQGSVEAVTGSLLQLDQSRVQLKILHAGTGDVSEADVSLASASGGVVVAFNVRHEGNSLKLAESAGVEVLPFDVIYHVTETIEKRMKGELAPETREVEVGQIEVRQLFTVGKTSVIAGCMVIKGKAIRNAKAVVTRGKQVVFTGILDNLKRFKDDAKEVAQGYECGVSFDKFNDLVIGDIITVFTEEVINAV